jgi:hypothetical protein
MNEKVFHIYAGQQCILNCIGEDEFRTTWNTVCALVGLMKSDYSLDDLSYEEVTVPQYEEASY